MNKRVSIVDVSYTENGEGSTITLYRPFGKLFVGKTYKYTFERYIQLLQLTTSPKWITRYYPNIQISELV